MDEPRYLTPAETEFVLAHEDEIKFGTPVVPSTAGENSWDRAQRKKRERATKGGRIQPGLPVTNPFTGKPLSAGGWNEPQAQPGGVPIRTARKTRRSPAKPRSRAGRGKPACKYGPRDANGYCPKKPTTARTIKAKAPKPYKLPRSLSRSAGAVGRTTAAAVVGATARAAIKGAPLIKQLLKMPVTRVAGAIGARAAAGTAGAVLGAGLLSYYVTSKIIAARKNRRMKRAEEAGIAADGYRQARRDLEKQQGHALTAEQQRILAFNFKQQLEALGLSTSDLGGL